MKRNHRKRHFRVRWISEGLVAGPLVFVLVAGAGCPSLFQSETQRAVHIQQAVVGRDGDKTIAGATQVNDYAVLTANAATGATSITVDAIANLQAHFTNALATGDLVLIIQMAGATMDTTNTATYGTVSAANLGNAGHYEFAGVESVTGNQITLACGLKNDYTGAGGKTQVIRVPQYATLTIPSGASIIAPAWNGSVGGVVAVHAETTLQLDGQIDVSAKGFRGGAVDNTTSNGVTVYVSASNAAGAEKGEGIAGSTTDYDTLGGRFGRGAPANGGGGGDAHNGGGGGGANARHGNAWTGQGVMTVNTANDGTAWALDPNYADRGSEGGGRGGYTYSASTTADPTVTAPGNATWGGDNRRQVGGLGGHPLDNGPASRLFLGGGGGAGDGNNGVAGRGGNGGGLVFIIAGSISGGGSILANGEAGVNAADSNTGGDAAGGGGGGGTVVVHAVSVTGISISANGGGGGSQTGTQTDTEGPGGGGGGGYIAVAGGTVAMSATGALSGTTNHAVMAKFPANGATAGNDGQSDGDASSFLYCGMAPAANTPDTIIVTHPSDPSGNPQGAFTFGATEGAVTYECSLDGAAFAACNASYTTPALPDGSHTLAVRATDLSGNTDSTPATFTWTIVAGALDAGILDTIIVTHPTDPSSSPTGTFTFSSTHGPATYECNLDNAGWVACNASYTTPLLPDGPHTLSVRSTDLAGNTDTTPATFGWTIVAGTLDAGVIDTIIVTHPTDPSGSPIGTFTFESTHDPATYECDLDNAGWAACDASYTTPLLPDGPHTLAVRSTDLIGNTDPTPATFAWTIVAGALDAGVLDTIIVTHPPNPSASPTGTFTFGSTHGPGTYECSLDSGAWAACDQTYTTPPLPDGTHTIAVRATDINGDTDTTPATFTWDIIAGLLDAGARDAGSGPVADAAAADLPGGDDVAVFADAGKADQQPASPDARPPQQIDSAVGEDALVLADSSAANGGDAPVALLDSSAPDLAANADAETPGPDAAPDLAEQPGPGSDAAAPITKADAAAPAGNKDAAVATANSPSLLGGGFCNISPSRASPPASFALLALAALIVLRRRRSR